MEKALAERFLFSVCFMSYLVVSRFQAERTRLWGPDGQQ